MSENKFNFTFDRLNNLTHDGGKRRLLFHDITQKGLVLCITHAGNKSFQFHHWDKTRQRSVVMTLGKFPALTINTAREYAAELIVAINKGIDVIEHRRSAKEEDTFSDVFYDWLEKHAKPHKRSWREDERRYNLYMKGKLGNKSLSWFSTDRVRKWHNDITKTPKQRGGEIVTVNDRGRKSKKVVYVTGSTATSTCSPHFWRHGSLDYSRQHWNRW